MHQEARAAGAVTTFILGCLAIGLVVLVVFQPPGGDSDSDASGGEAAPTWAPAIEAPVAAADPGAGITQAVDPDWATSTATATGIPERALLAYAGAARLAMHRGDRVETDRRLTQAMRARPSLTYMLPTLAVRVRLQLAKMHSALGDHTTARHLLREIDDILLHRPALGSLVDEVADLRRILTASPQGGVAGASALTSAELRLLPYLQTHLTIREIGDRLFVSRNTVSSEVSSIYRKLGVSSRHDAVERATAIGLLGG